MKHLYEKSKLFFTLAWIAAYVVTLSVTDNLSASIGISKIITAPWAIVFVLLIIGFLVKAGLTEEFGLCKFKGSFKGVLFFIPVIPILALYLWHGVTWESTVLEALLSAVAMLCVGFSEEMLFRGFLFKTMSEDNVKVAILVSSLLFGVGHIVNLLNGRELVSTLLQICYATALGFLLTMLFYKGKSILPCVILHGILNVISVFNVPGTGAQKIIDAAVLSIIAVVYGLWIWKKAGEN